jgi:hypothetical protein
MKERLDSRNLKSFNAQLSYDNGDLRHIDETVNCFESKCLVSNHFAIQRQILYRQSKNSRSRSSAQDVPTTPTFAKKSSDFNILNPRKRVKMILKAENSPLIAPNVENKKVPEEPQKLLIPLAPK